MSDTTRAEKLLNEAGRSVRSERSERPERSDVSGGISRRSLPPPPGPGTLPFSLPSSPLKQDSKAAVDTPDKPAGALANAKAKWVVVKDKCTNVLKTQGIAAAVVFVIVAGIMAAVNPPICQTKSKNADEKPKRSVVKILVWALLAAALAMIIPLGIEYAKNKKSKATASVVTVQ
jgi:hypothetical protein